MHIRTGMINGSYTSPFSPDSEDQTSNVDQSLQNGGFSVVPSVDVEFEIFDQTKKSWNLRTTIAMNMSSGTMNYNYFGVGRKYYFKGIGKPIDIVGKGGNYKIYPKTRQYYGYDFGMSRVSVLSFGPSLEAVSTGIDIGAHWGYLKQMGKSWSLATQLGGSYAYGISTVSASGINIKILFGVAYNP